MFIFSCISLQHCSTLRTDIDHRERPAAQNDLLHDDGEGVDVSSLRAGVSVDDLSQQLGCGPQQVGCALAHRELHVAQDLVDAEVCDFEEEAAVDHTVLRLESPVRTQHRTVQEAHALKSI